MPRGSLLSKVAFISSKTNPERSPQRGCRGIDVGNAPSTARCPPSLAIRSRGTNFSGAVHQNIMVIDRGAFRHAVTASGETANQMTSKGNASSRDLGGGPVNLGGQREQVLRARARA